MSKYLFLLLLLPSWIAAQTAHCLFEFERQTDAFFASNVAFSPSGQYLGFGTKNGNVKIMDLSNGSVYFDQNLHKGIAVCVAFSNDGKWLASGGKDGMVQLIDLEKKAVVKAIAAHDKTVNSVGFDPSSNYLFSGSRDNAIKIWKVPEGAIFKEISGIKNNIRSVIYSPDGKYIICATNALFKAITYFDNNTGNKVRDIEAPNVNEIVLNPDETILAAAALKKYITLRDVKSGDSVAGLIGHSNYIHGVAFSPGGRYLVSGSDDKTVKLWDVQEKKCIHTFEGHAKNVKAVAFSPDGKKIASSSWDYTIKVWDITFLNLKDELIYVKPDDSKLPVEDKKIVDHIFANLEFETGKAVIQQKSFAALDALAQLMNKKTAYKLTISGHTDNVGDATFNYRLSVQRAEAVKKYLLGKKVADSRIVATGYGATKPLADNNTDAGRQKNRRVEFYLH